MFNEPENLVEHAQNTATMLQDLLHIRDILGEHGLTSNNTPSKSVSNEESRVKEPSESISSSDESSSDEESEAEIEASLVLPTQGNEELPTSSLTVSASPDSVSETSSSEELEELEEQAGSLLTDVLETYEDDEDPIGTSNTNTYLRTKNEVVDPSVVLPDFTHIMPHEKMEKIGEVMSIVDSVVIVKGMPSAVANRASETALDTDSLLVFEDRRVLGFIYETFGPTNQPLYQVKFGPSFPLDPEIAIISRPVFHVPSRSKFVFPSHLQKVKGSDASNIHDEEIADDEAEFSDDEAELAFKRAKKRNTKMRPVSIYSSRNDKQNPSWMRDQDMIHESSYALNPYDDSEPYGFEPGPSRPPPKPYDDPYEDVDVSTLLEGVEPSSSSPRIQSESSRSFTGGFRSSSWRSRGRSDGRMNGRGRDRGRSQRGRGRATNHNQFTPHTQSSWSPQSQASQNDNSYSPSLPNLPSNSWGNFSSPTSPSFSHGHDTGQTPSTLQQSLGTLYDQTHTNSWSVQNHQNFSMPSSSFQPAIQYQPYVQPHINPRFAAYFGLNLNFAANHQQQPVHQASGFLPSTVHQERTDFQEPGHSQQPSENAEYSIPVHMSSYRH